MNKDRAIARRRMIREIILKTHNSHARSVDDWYHIVGGAWVKGWQDAPGKNTVKSELLVMRDKGLLVEKSIHRGHFHQLRFRKPKAGDTTVATS